MKTKILFLVIACGIVSASAQSPNPPMVVVPAANAAASPAATPVVTQNTNELQTTLKTLEQMRAANAETLKRQEAVLQQLDELQKAAEQLKIFSRRTGG